MAQGVPGSLRPRIFSNFSTTRVGVRQSNAPDTFTPGEVPGTHFQRLSRPQGTWFCRKEPRKKSPVTPPGIDPGTVRLVAQRKDPVRGLVIYLVRVREETSKVLHLEHSFIRCWNLDISEGRFEIPGKFLNLVMEMDEDQLDRSCEKWCYLTHSLPAI